MAGEGMPTYVRMAEAEPMPGGGIPPRPVRDASPLSVPGRRARLAPVCLWRLGPVAVCRGPLFWCAGVASI